MGFREEILLRKAHARRRLESAPPHTVRQRRLTFPLLSERTLAHAQRPTHARSATRPQAELADRRAAVSEPASPLPSDASAAALAPLLHNTPALGSARSGIRGRRALRAGSLHPSAVRALPRPGRESGRPPRTAAGPQAAGRAPRLGPAPRGFAGRAAESDARTPRRSRGGCQGSRPVACSEPRGRKAASLSRGRATPWSAARAPADYRCRPGGSVPWAPPRSGPPLSRRVRLRGVRRRPP